MDALKERVLIERNRILNAKLEIALKQRDGYRKNYHEVCRIPHQERREITEDNDAELERAGRPVGSDD